MFTPSSYNVLASCTIIYKINSVLHLIDGIFKVLQKLLKCFSGPTLMDFHPKFHDFYDEFEVILNFLNKIRTIW